MSEDILTELALKTGAPTMKPIKRIWDMYLDKEIINIWEK